MIKVRKRREDTVVKIPANRPTGKNIFVVPNEIDLLPDVAEEAIGELSPKVISVVHEIRPENPYLEVFDLASGVRAKRVVKRRAVVPLNVVLNLSKLLMENVGVETPGPVVPEVTEFDARVAHVHVKNRVELLRPRHRTWNFS